MFRFLEEKYSPMIRVEQVSCTSCNVVPKFMVDSSVFNALEVKLIWKDHHNYKHKGFTHITVSALNDLTWEQLELETEAIVTSDEVVIKILELPELNSLSKITAQCFQDEALRDKLVFHFKINIK